jgi:glycerol-1-phosphatase
MVPVSARGGGCRYGSWVIDLDGVVWLGGEPIQGSSDAVARLRQEHIRVVFATNNAAPTVSDLVARLRRAGIEVDASDIVTSAQAAASMMQPDQSAVVCADDGVAEALSARGVRIVERGPADAVVVGWTHRFDFDRLATAADAARMGARLIGTNEDATYPTPDGLLPGAGSLLAAVATASHAVPEVAGKPHDPLVSLLRARVPDVSLVVGDRPSTDGSLARRLEVPFGLVRSGVTRDGREPMVVAADVDARDLCALVTSVLDHPDRARDA